MLCWFPRISIADLLENAFGNSHNIARVNFGRGIGGHGFFFLAPHVANIDFAVIRPIGVASRQGDGAQHGQSVLERIFAGLIHLAHNVEWPVVLDFDADFWVFEVAGLQRGRDLGHELVDGQPFGFDLSDQRQLYLTGTVNQELSAEIFLAVNIDSKLIARSELIVSSVIPALAAGTDAVDVTGGVDGGGAVSVAGALGPGRPTPWAKAGVIRPRIRKNSAITNG